ncbi:MAG TPA: SDR family oxidoreductase [Bryobacteraceae bacterium]|nr:SDR family oxidoreductase [Bryobacteraceae bacterium]
MDQRLLSGKTAVITGASRGIGLATALTFARAGVSKLLLHFNSHREGAEVAADAARAAGAQVDLFGADLSTDTGIQELCDGIRAAGPFDILINNAGHLVQRSKLAEFTPDLYDRIMNLNAKSAWFIAQAAASGMMERRNGVIVNVSSIAARNGGGPGATIYAASKAAVAAMTKGMARELAPQGIRVNAVSPGTVDNDFHQKYSTREMLQNVVAATPAGTLGTNEEVADVILFLCTEPSRYMHGQTLEINGGMYMV